MVDHRTIVADSAHHRRRLGAPSSPTRPEDYQGTLFAFVSVGDPRRLGGAREAAAPRPPSRWATATWWCWAARASALGEHAVPKVAHVQFRPRGVF